MTAVLIVSMYLVALAVFLGLDIVSKVPPTLYAVVLGGVGAVGGVAVVGAMHLWGRAEGDQARALVAAAAVLAGLAAGGGLFAVGRLAQAGRQRGKAGS